MVSFHFLLKNHVSRHSRQKCFQLVNHTEFCLFGGFELFFLCIHRVINARVVFLRFGKGDGNVGKMVFKNVGKNWRRKNEEALKM
jgi:hypothetical protein